MAFTQAQLTALDDAIALGALEVRYQDKTVQYRSLSEMLQLRDLMRRELGLASAANTRIYPSHSKGTTPAASDDESID